MTSSDRMKKTFDILPCPKPRMTQRDRWKGRDCVARYRGFADEVRLLKVPLPESGAHITFFLPMPRSWSQKKRQAMNGKPHKQRPDVDNLIKGLMDAVYGEDSHIHDVRISKVWAVKGRIEIRENSNSTKPNFDYDI